MVTFGKPAATARRTHAKTDGGGAFYDATDDPLHLTNLVPWTEEERLALARGGAVVLVEHNGLDRADARDLLEALGLVDPRPGSGLNAVQQMLMDGATVKTIMTTLSVSQGTVAKNRKILNARGYDVPNTPPPNRWLGP